MSENSGCGENCTLSAMWAFCQLLCVAATKKVSRLRQSCHHSLSFPAVYPRFSPSLTPLPVMISSQPLPHDLDPELEAIYRRKENGRALLIKGTKARSAAIAAISSSKRYNRSSNAYDGSGGGGRGWQACDRGAGAGRQPPPARGSALPTLPRQR